MSTYVALLVSGLGNTALLSLLTFIFGGAVGLVFALARIAPERPLRIFMALYIQIVQGVPLLVLMGLAFFGPPLLGLGSVSALGAATLAMTIYASVYLAEIWRGSLQSVAKSQWESAECLGLSRLQRMSHVIMPQAFRISIPPTVGFMVAIVKNTSVASLVIGFNDLTYNAKVINNATFQPFLYFGIAGAMYFAICYPLSRFSRRMERRLDVANR